MKKIDEEWQNSEAFKVINEHRNEVNQLCSDLNLANENIARLFMINKKLTAYIKKQWLEQSKPEVLDKPDSDGIWFNENSNHPIEIVLLGFYLTHREDSFLASC